MGYGVFRRRFHDTLLLDLVKVSFGLSPGESWQLFDLGQLGPSSKFYWNDSTPDLFVLSLGAPKRILEVSITRNKDLTKSTKNAKYLNLIEKNNERGGDIDLLYFFWSGEEDMVSNFPNREVLLDCFKLDTELLSLGFKLSSFPSGRLTGIDECRIETIQETLNLPPVDPPTYNDEVYLVNLVDNVIKSVIENKKHRAPRLAASEDLRNEFLYEWEESRFVKPANTAKIKKVFQLGVPSEVLEEFPFDSPGEVDFFDAAGYCGKIHNFSRGPLKLTFSQQEKIEKAMEGPGRKALLRREKKERQPPTHLSVCDDHRVLVDEFISDYMLGLPDDKTTLHNTILRFYQRCSKEIIMNSMRRRNAGSFELISSGFRGVWVLLHPGPPLRTESNTVFIKIISRIPSVQSPLAKQWKKTGNHFESSWISVDTDRLNHWQRCYDKLMLTFKTLSNTLIDMRTTADKCFIAESGNGSFAFQTMIYLEDKLLTSQTIECTRYFFMRSTGDGGCSHLVSKLPNRVGSVLQSYVLQGLKAFVCEVLMTDLRKLLKMENRSEVKTEASVYGLLPRMFTPGPRVSINYLINEMYMGCYYNPDRQNKVQDAFKILEKIQDQEVKLREELDSRSPLEQSNHLSGYHTVEEDISHCLSKNPESHYYSSNAVRIGVRLQREKNPCDLESKFEKVMEKKLSEFATFKASVWEIKEILDDWKDTNPKDLGIRSKCLVLVTELSNMSLLTVRDVLLKEMENDGILKTTIQIFKKNQWGGVREILILRLVSRIIINIIESLSREICEKDSREMLTEGRNKQIFMKKDHDELLREFEKNDKLLLIKHSDDMSKWCQKFIPLIFRHLFEGTQMGEIDKTALWILHSHCRKIIEFPRDLVKMWQKFPDKFHENSLQQLKEAFLTEGKISMINISNMGQGILHYSSSALALACDSFRDVLFDMCILKLRLEKALSHRVRLSSDDKGEIICLNRGNKTAGLQYSLFCECSEWSRRLFSMELSPKASSNYFVYEFNSTFLINANCVSPLIKFSLAACNPIRTDSFTEAVQESFSRIRQLFENGATLDLVEFAHKLNKTYLEEIFGTGRGSPNAPETLFSSDRRLFPYDLGVYPIMRPELSVTLGPEYYNWIVSKDKVGLENCSRIYREQNVSEVSDFLDDPESYFKMSSFYKREPIRIPQGFVSQLQSLKKRVGFDFNVLQEKLAADYLFLLRDEMTVDETKLKVFLKLCGRSARLAVKRTSEAIYLGRSGAFRTSKSWTLGDAKDEKVTYADFVKELKPGMVDPQRWFPLSQVYESVGEVTYSERIKRSHVYLKPVKMALTRSYFSKSDSFRNLFLSSLGLEDYDESQVQRFKDLLRVEWTSMTDFEIYCKEKGYKPNEYVMMAMSWFETSKTSDMKCLSPGINTKTLSDTLNSLVKHSSCADYIYVTDKSYDLVYTESLVYQYTDLMILEQLRWAEVPLELRAAIKEFLLNNDFRGRNSRLIEKCVSILALSVMQLNDAVKYITSQGFTFRWYIKKQHKLSDGTWRGDLNYAVNGRGNVFSIMEVRGRRFIRISKFSRNTFKNVLTSALWDLGWKLDELTNEVGYVKRGDIFLQGRNFKQAETPIMLKCKVLDIELSDKVPPIPVPAWVKLDINERNQFTLYVNDVCLINYSLKFCTDLSAIRKYITLKDRLEIIKGLDKFLGISEEVDMDDEFDDPIEMNEFLVSLHQVGISEEFENILEDPIETVDSGDFSGIDMSDIREGLTIEPKKNESVYQQLIELLFEEYPSDNPRNLPKDELICCCQWIHIQREIDLEYNEFREWIFRLYCKFIGVVPDKLTEMFSELETMARPVTILSQKRVVRPSKFRLTIDQ